MQLQDLRARFFNILRVGVVPVRYRKFEAYRAVDQVALYANTIIEFYSALELLRSIHLSFLQQHHMFSLDRLIIKAREYRSVTPLTSLLCAFAI
jgi:hypothetical protein